MAKHRTRDAAKDRNYYPPKPPKSKLMKTNPISLLFAAGSPFEERDAAWILWKVKIVDRKRIMAIPRAELRVLHNSVRSSTTAFSALLIRLKAYDLTPKDKVEFDKIMARDQPGKEEDLGLFVRNIALRAFKTKYKRKTNC